MGTPNTRPPDSAQSHWALLAILLGILFSNAMTHAWVTVVPAAAKLFTVSMESVRWMAYSHAIVAIPAILMLLPAIRRWGLHSCVFVSVGFLFFGSLLQCFSVAHPQSTNETRSHASYAWVQVGSFFASASIGPFQVCCLSLPFPPAMHSASTVASDKLYFQLSKQGCITHACSCAWSYRMPPRDLHQ